MNAALREIDRHIEARQRLQATLAACKTLTARQRTRLQALTLQLAMFREVRRMIAGARTFHPRRNCISPDSNTGLAMTILKDAGRPLRIRDIVRRSNIYGRKLRPSSIGPRIAKLAREGRIFRQYAPGVYGLADYPVSPAFDLGSDPEVEYFRAQRLAACALAGALAPLGLGIATEAAGDAMPIIAASLTGDRDKKTATDRRLPE